MLQATQHNCFGRWLLHDRIRLGAKHILHYNIKAVAAVKQIMQLSAVLLDMQMCNMVQKLFKLFMTLWHRACPYSQS